MRSTSFPFARQFAGFVIAALVPAVLTAFLTIPFNLGGHPGEARSSRVLTGGPATEIGTAQG